MLMKRLSMNNFRLIQTALLLLTLSGEAGSSTSNAPVLTLYVPFNETVSPSGASTLQQALLESANSAQEVDVVTDWNTYLMAIRDGASGVFLAAPHFAAWLIHEHDFSPIARINDTLSYTVMSRARDHQLFSVRDLAGRVVCTQPRLSLDFVMASNLLPADSKPMQLAVTRSIAERLANRDERCAAFAVSERLAREVEASSPGEFVRLYQSKQWPPYALLINKELANGAGYEQIRGALLEPAMQQWLADVVRHETNSVEFVSATAADYPPELRNLLIEYWRPAAAQ